MWRSETVELLSAEVGDREWAFPLAAIERVVATVAIVPLPESPAGVRGAINVGGEAVPVLDLELRAGGEPRAIRLDGRIVLARTSTRRVALPVDRVGGVIAAAVSPPADRSPPELAGVAALPDGVLAIYDLDAFLSAEDERVLAAALEGGEP